MRVYPEVGNNLMFMNTSIYHTPSCLIPKKLFKEEKKIEYFDFLINKPTYENIGKEELENYSLVYPKHKEEDSIHVISLMYQNIKENISEQSHIFCVSEHENTLHFLCIKEHKIEYAGFVNFTVKEDVLYNITNVFQQFYENISQVNFFYQQLTPDVLRLLVNYFEMKKL
jgi:hypothetical protein